LVLALVATLGFLAGVEVQKRQETPVATGGAAFASTRGGGGGQRGAGLGTGGGRRGAGGGGGTGAGTFGGGGNATVGEVKVIDGSTLYVVDQNGNTLRVATSPSSRVSKSAEGSTQDIRPGDTVVVQGSKAPDGSVTAAQITIR
jgi:hypothetical protein